MTNYNDGEWHGWNGGECPVHPKSKVEAVWHDPRQNSAGVTGPRQAKVDNEPTLAWAHVVKFRVVQEYHDPQEWWAVGKHLHDTEADALSFRDSLIRDYGLHHATTPIVHVREVQADAKAVA